MKKLTILVILLFSISIASPIFAGPFSDVNPDHWSYKALKVLVTEAILEEFPNDNFENNKPITRLKFTHFFLMIIKIYKIDEESLNNGCFTIFRKLAIEFSDELGLLGVRTGSLDSFEKSITRSERERKSIEIIHKELKSIRKRFEKSVALSHQEYDNRIKYKRREKFYKIIMKITGICEESYRYFRKIYSLGKNLTYDYSESSLFYKGFLRLRFDKLDFIKDNCVLNYFSYQDEFGLNSLEIIGLNSMTSEQTDEIKVRSVNKNLFLGYDYSENLVTVINNFRFNRQTYTLGKGYIFDNDADIDIMLLKKEYCGTIFQFLVFQIDRLTKNPLKFEMFEVNQAWDRFVTGAYLVSCYSPFIFELDEKVFSFNPKGGGPLWEIDYSSLVLAENETKFSLILDAKLARNIVAYLEYVSENINFLKREGEKNE